MIIMNFNLLIKATILDCDLSLEKEMIMKSSLDQQFHIEMITKSSLD